MSKLDVLLRKVKTLPKGAIGERVYAEMQYARNVSLVHGGQYDDMISQAAQVLISTVKQEGALCDKAAYDIENMLLPMADACKAFKVIFVGHAHIDMNWMWRYDETVMVTLDTFRTMLDLLEEYPQFVFAQSQASTYRIVEEAEPTMLDEIRKYVAEGRWEVTASTWVEADRNMPNAESVARHHLYTKRYLPKLLGIDPSALNLDYEPDTFGHSENLPELLNAAGVKYYYHCRGNKKEDSLYRWQSPSGKEIIVYLDEQFYGGYIEPECVFTAPGFCTSRGIGSMLKVYGVGDHGGGPTRRDLERIIDMMSWPVFPTVKFGTYAEFFAEAEAIKANLPVVRRELNFIFTGCYTTQTRIKMGNRISEALLNEAESINSFATLQTGALYNREAYQKAWCDVLFNQFHDIITGSGVIDTREYAMALYAKTISTANVGKRNAFRSIANSIDTSSAPYDLTPGTFSEGAGVGFLEYDFKLPPIERGRGNNRILHFYNSLPIARREVTEVIVWDWNQDLDRLVFTAPCGTKARYQVVESDKVNPWGHNYWGHCFTRIMLEVDVPPMGYTTYLMTLEDGAPAYRPTFHDQRLHLPYSYKLENDKVCVKFDQNTGAIVSFVDKATGEEVVGSPAGIFRYIEEDTNMGMTSWIVGRYMNISDISKSVRIHEVMNGKLKSAISIEAKFKNSKVKAVISLEAGSPFLRYDIEIDWHEIGTMDTCVPGIYFHFPHASSCDKYKYDIPMGVLERDAIDQDLPAQSFTAAPIGVNALALMCNTKYGFRCVDNSMNVTLVRSSFEPDPYPEYGIHKMSIQVGLIENATDKRLLEASQVFIHPLTILSGNKPHKGSLPMCQSFLELASGSIVISAVKMAEDDDSLIIRGYEVLGCGDGIVIKLLKEPKFACFTDTNEMVCYQNGIEIAHNTVKFSVAPKTVFTLKLRF